MDFSSKGTKELFFKQYGNLTEQVILEINHKSLSGDINNVVAGLCTHCFGVWLIDDSPQITFQLFYINGNGKLEGDFLHLSLEMPEREDLTLFFASFLVHNYEGLDLIDTFNTFQHKLRSLFEKIGFTTVTNLDFKDLIGPVLLAPNTRGILKINFLERLTVLRQIFNYDPQEHLNADGECIYLMLNNKNKYIKIGKSKTPRFREKTLQGEEPDIHMIACWKAPAKKERELHDRFVQQRKRGEWFKLSFSELQIVKEIMAEYV